MSDLSILRRDIKRAFSKARVFAVSRKVVSASGVAEKLSSTGVKTVFFDRADEVEPQGAVFLAFEPEDVCVAREAAFFAAPASAPLEVKMRCSYVSSFDGESAVLEMADLIMVAKRS
ncbi:hypothetical protein [Candidatus Mycalebacterium sp.]